MNQKKRIKILIIFFIAFLFINFNIASAANNSFSEGLRLSILKIVKSIDYWIGGLINYKQIEEENNILMFQNRALKSLLIEYQDLKSENELLKEALEMNKTQKINFILANVVGRSPLNFSQTFVIDKGEEDGIKVGQAVVWAGKVLVGEIIETSKSFATVRTINDTEFKVAVFIGEKKIEGLFKGNGFLAPYLDMVPIEEELSEKEVVYTSGLDNKFIRGLYVGDVLSISKQEGKIFQEIKVKPAVDWTKLYEVLVII